ncbi:hypothetical protein LOKG_00072 [Loktanella phage pCB2051-A]|uniref:Uncharacterized protein n=1 Tax=Loktanella phage pCB2051-A TaxID=754044 RepID=M4QRP4_9CAUD|nr:hypothetical protein LOKG_00072 [Loktanella phage pCB2051-A]AGH31508.1 hypothetical protein LOKG_00072 [Loktanella phage pCB2051-A]
MISITLAALLGISVMGNFIIWWWFKSQIKNITLAEAADIVWSKFDSEKVIAAMASVPETYSSKMSAGDIDFLRFRSAILSLRDDV